MRITMGQRLSKLSAAVRQATLAALCRIPLGAENWRPAPGALSAADMAQHLLDADLWVFQKLEVGEILPFDGVSRCALVKSRDQYDELLRQLAQAGLARAERIAVLSDQKLSETVRDGRVGSEHSLLWFILRDTLDHEVHHEGQLALYPRLIGAAAIVS